ncbi:MAG: hypothetical protein IPJ45_09605 [Ignavibacteria bacterium]|nr:hypothetical protein [Ignavibacteria bacterium]
MVRTINSYISRFGFTQKLTIKSIDFSSDGKYLANVIGRSVTLWDQRSGEAINEIGIGEVENHLAFLQMEIHCNRKL